MVEINWPLYKEVYGRSLGKEVWATRWRKREASVKVLCLECAGPVWAVWVFTQTVGIASAKKVDAP